MKTKMAQEDKNGSHTYFLYPFYRTNFKNKQKKQSKVFRFLIWGQSKEHNTKKTELGKNINVFLSLDRFPKTI